MHRLAVFLGLRAAAPAIRLVGIEGVLSVTTAALDYLFLAFNSRAAGPPRPKVSLGCWGTLSVYAETHSCLFSNCHFLSKYICRLDGTFTSHIGTQTSMQVMLHLVASSSKLFTSFRCLPVSGLQGAPSSACSEYTHGPGTTLWPEAKADCSYSTYVLSCSACLFALLLRNPIPHSSPL